MNDFNPFDLMTFTNDRCFICGNLLDGDNYTQEHIYPKWLQRQFNLWDKELVLLNESKIKYRNLKIPCCIKCNNILSNEIEKPIREALQRGYSDFIKLDRDIIFKWLNKLSYGMLFKELSLKTDLSDNSSSSIYTPEMLKLHQMQFCFLKSIINKSQYCDKPYSILIFKLNTNSNDQYWASDNIFTKTFFINLNDIGIIAHLMDNGSQEENFMHYNDMADLLTKVLHPIQFRELCAKFLYKTSLYIGDPFYTLLYDNDGNIKTIVSHNRSWIEYNKWDQKMYAKVLSHYLKPWGIKFSDIYIDEDHVMSWLRNEDNSFKVIVDDMMD
jgi:hypothetical protein